MEESQAYTLGARVDGLYKGNLEDLWYPGRIASIDYNGVYSIQYDDGEVEETVKADCIRSHVAGTLSHGTRVSGNYRQSGDWYFGTIVEVQENGKFTIRYDDGEEEVDVAAQCVAEVENIEESVREEETLGEEAAQDQSAAVSLEYADSPNAIKHELAEPTDDKAFAASHDVAPIHDATEPLSTAFESHPSEPELNVPKDTLELDIVSSITQLQETYVDIAIVKSHLCRIVQYMRECPQQTATLLHTSHGELLLLSILRHHASHAMVQCYAMVLLRRYILIIPSSIAFFRDSGTISHILGTISAFRDDAIFQASAFGTIGIFNQNNALSDLQMQEMISRILASLSRHPTYSIHTRQVHYYASQVLLDTCLKPKFTSFVYTRLCCNIHDKAVSHRAPLFLLLWYLKQSLHANDAKCCLAIGTLLLHVVVDSAFAAAIVKDSEQGVGILSRFACEYGVDDSVAKLAASAPWKKLSSNLKRELNSDCHNVPLMLTQNAPARTIGSKSQQERPWSLKTQRQEREKLLMATYGVQGSKKRKPTAHASRRTTDFYARNVSLVKRSSQKAKTNVTSQSRFGTKKSNDNHSLHSLANELFQQKKTETSKVRQQSDRLTFAEKLHHMIDRAKTTEGKQRAERGMGTTGRNRVDTARNVTKIPERVKNNAATARQSMRSPLKKVPVSQRNSDMYVPTLQNDSVRKNVTKVSRRENSLLATKYSIMDRPITSRSKTRVPLTDSETSSQNAPRPPSHEKIEVQTVSQSAAVENAVHNASETSTVSDEVADPESTQHYDAYPLVLDNDEDPSVDDLKVQEANDYKFDFVQLQVKKALESVCEIQLAESQVVSQSKVEPSFDVEVQLEVSQSDLTVQVSPSAIQHEAGEPFPQSGSESPVSYSDPEFSESDVEVSEPLKYDSTLAPEAKLETKEEIGDSQGIGNHELDTKRDKQQSEHDIDSVVSNSAEPMVPIATVFSLNESDTHGTLLSDPESLVYYSDPESSSESDTELTENQSDPRDPLHNDNKLSHVPSYTEAISDADDGNTVTTNDIEQIPQAALEHPVSDSHPLLQCDSDLYSDSPEDTRIPIIDADLTHLSKKVSNASESDSDTRAYSDSDPALNSNSAVNTVASLPQSLVTDGSDSGNQQDITVQPNGSIEYASDAEASNNESKSELCEAAMEQEAVANVDVPETYDGLEYDSEAVLDCESEIVPRDNLLSMGGDDGITESDCGPAKEALISDIVPESSDSYEDVPETIFEAPVVIDTAVIESLTESDIVPESKFGEANNVAISESEALSSELNEAVAESDANSLFDFDHDVSDFTTNCDKVPESDSDIANDVPLPESEDLSPKVKDTKPVPDADPGIESGHTMSNCDNIPESDSEDAKDVSIPESEDPSSYVEDTEPVPDLNPSIETHPTISDSTLNRDIVAESDSEAVEDAYASESEPPVNDEKDSVEFNEKDYTSIYPAVREHLMITDPVSKSTMVDVAHVAASDSDAASHNESDTVPNSGSESLIPVPDTTLSRDIVDSEYNINAPATNPEDIPKPNISPISLTNQSPPKDNHPSSPSDVGSDTQYTDPEPSSDSDSESNIPISEPQPASNPSQMDTHASSPPSHPETCDQHSPTATATATSTLHNSFPQNTSILHDTSLHLTSQAIITALSRLQPQLSTETSPQAHLTAALYTSVIASSLISKLARSHTNTSKPSLSPSPIIQTEISSLLHTLIDQIPISPSPSESYNDSDDDFE